MSDIYITGHRNPDMDSIAASYSYAVLKNQLDGANHYIPSALGPLNRLSRSLFERLSIEQPFFLKDAYTRVSAVMKRPSLLLTPDEPVYELVNMYNQANPSVVPVMNDDGSFLGLLSVDDINRYFLSENRMGRPVYNFKVRNIARVIHGYYLKKGEMEEFCAPIMVGAMRYEVFKKRLEECEHKPVLVVGCRKDHIALAIEKQFPGIILTGVEEESLEGIDFSDFKGFVYVSVEDTAESLRLLRLTVPVSDILHGKKPPMITEDMLFETAKGILAESEYRGLPVFDKDGSRFIGFITRRCFLSQPRVKIIMVDHNESGQSVPGLQEAEILEILDHHRLDAPKTRNPITILASPVGSTCTIVYSQFRQYGITPDPVTAQVMLAGLVSDTVMLKSPTTTATDRETAAELCKAGGVEFEAFCHELFSEGSSLSNLDVEKAVGGDFKMYDEENVRFGIGQVEVTTLDDVEEVKEKYLAELESVKEKEKLGWAMLLVTDVLSDDSVLLVTDFSKNYRFSYAEKEKGVYLLPGVLSRKKQLLPEVLRVLGG